MIYYSLKFGFLESKSRNVKDKKVYWKGTNEEIGLYSGSVNKGLMNGEGELTYNKSKALNWTYKGSFKDGKKHGTGEIIFALEKYEGSFDEREPIVIKGSFSEGYPSGKCVLQYANGTFYEGNVEKQNQHLGYCRDGYGTCKYNVQAFTTAKGVQDSKFVAPRDGSVYDGEWKRNKRHGKGVLINRDGEVVFEGDWKYDRPYSGTVEIPIKLNEGIIKYKGGLLEGLPSGFGSAVIYNSNKKLFKPNQVGHYDYEYAGEWKMGKKDGKGKLKGGLEVYEGEWRNDEKHGLGKTTNRDGSYHEGNYINGLKKGHGKYFWTEGSSDWYEGFYEGNFDSGFWTGKGVIIWAIDSKKVVLCGDALAKVGYSYAGEWAGNKINGKGILKNQNGEIIFEGEWKDNLPYKGTVKTPLKFNEEIISYVGAINNGVPEGNGVNNYPIGDIYSGNWKKGKHHGKGTMTWAIDNKEIVLAGEIIAKANYSYEGDYNEGKINGKGILKNQNGEIIFEGEWKDNLPNIGLINKPLKINRKIPSYSGEIMNGLPQGLGVCYFPSGTKYYGNWEKGNIEGLGQMIDLDNDIIIENRIWYNNSCLSTKEIEYLKTNNFDKAINLYQSILNDVFHYGNDFEKNALFKINELEKLKSEHALKLQIIKNIFSSLLKHKEKINKEKQIADLMNAFNSKESTNHKDNLKTSSFSKDDFDDFETKEFTKKNSATSDDFDDFE